VNLQPLFESDYFKQNGFEWLLIEGKDPRLKTVAEKLLARWKSPSEVHVDGEDSGYLLYRLSDE
jgi:hypothetical protein